MFHKDVINALSFVEICLSLEWVPLPPVRRLPRGTVSRVEYTGVSVIDTILEAEDQVTVDVFLSHCRGFGMRPAKIVHEDNPFTAASRAILADPPRVLSAVSVLGAYYATWCPTSAADVLGLPPDHQQASRSAFSSVLPWWDVTPEDYEAALRGGTSGYYEQHNMSDWSIDVDGHTQWGPISLRKLSLEVWRLCNLCACIARDGLNPEHPPLLVSVLLDDRSGEWICCVKDGLHRVAVFGALGFEQVPMTILYEGGGRIVRRSKSASWPQVIAGRLTEEEALGVFDRYVDGAL